MNMKRYQVAIIGAGVTGTSILYVLSKYTDVKSIVLIEKYSGVAKVQSASTNNSQTLHFGDIETHYTPEKAKKVKEAADMVRIYVEKHGRHLYRKFHKMALAVGKDEVKTLTERQKVFSKIFPKLKLIGRKELEKIEPNVVKGRDPDVELAAAFTEDGYAVNYGKLSEDFVKEAQRSDKEIDILFNTSIDSIIKKDKHYLLKHKNTEIMADAVIVAASANSLTFAHRLGYGKDLILLPVAGDFFCVPKLLNGKVYMMQHPDLPFAAIHGDPDVTNPDETRFGPIAKVIPVLEKRNYASSIDFLKLFRFRWSALMSLLAILSKPVYYRYVFWNFLYGIPFIGKYFFLKEVRKIVPSLKGSQLKYGRGIGGIRPQVVDTKTKKVSLGEAKIVGDRIIFNITPSPGASVCLKNAEEDVRKVCEFLGSTFDQKRFDAEFKTG
ncbi:FAD-dependent oxidoreductase [Candidatus Woesearchaeota archaeon CG10_big_fil_rev_8_21_14_0_10_45_16]|nr:MAG: FAD-dependent oxidoreductase [Candidatus Woesearchaeota archaeon CG10_big_fil_rev_8_21_14_0_10_45_16]